MNKKSEKTNKPWKSGKKSAKKSGGFIKGFIKALVIILVVLVLAAIAINVVMERKPAQNTEHIDTETNRDMFEISDEKEESNSQKVTRKQGFYNILVIGRDKVALNTDVMIVASIDTANKKAATVQIPRDSYVEDENGVGSKINAVFARGYTSARTELNKLKNAAKGKSDDEIKTLCEQSSISITPEVLREYMAGKKTQDAICSEHGIKTLQNVISRTFGIYFDYYAIVSTDAFVKIVDAIGGVDVYVQEAMNYDDPYQDLHIHIPQGQQHLNGKEAEGFVRFRSGYVQADIARLDAQKIFLTAFFEKLVSFSSVTKVGDILGAVYDTVRTDLTLDNAVGFIKPALSIDLSNITMLTMQGTSYNRGMYYSLNKAENLKIVNEHFNIFTHPLSEVAANVVELVDSAPLSDPSGMTMGDISTDQPHLGFIKKPTPSQASPAKPQDRLPYDTEDKPEDSETDTPDVSQNGEEEVTSEDGSKDETQAENQNENQNEDIKPSEDEKDSEEKPVDDGENADENTDKGSDDTDKTEETEEQKPAPDTEDGADKEPAQEGEQDKDPETLLEAAAKQNSDKDNI